MYKVLYIILPVNRYLKIIKISENEICTFCNGEYDAILQVCFMCKDVFYIWSEVV